MKVLICDDSLAIRSKIKRMLQKRGIEEIALANDGQEAIDEYARFHPDVVILDLVMPNVDGKAALKAILEFDSGAKVIISSSLGSESDIEQCLSLGALSYIQKPFTDDVLSVALKSVSAPMQSE